MPTGMIWINVLPPYSPNGWSKRKIKCYGGEVVMFSAANQPKGVAYELSIGWRDLIKGNLSIPEIPGYQQNILKEPNVRILVAELKKHL